MRRLVKQVLPPWMYVLLLLTVLHQVVERVLRIPMPWLDAYLDPLLLMPILLQLLLWERRLLFAKGLSYVFSAVQLFLVFVLVSVVTEILFPRWNPYFIGDYWDVVCYGVGTFAFGLFANKPYVEE